MSLADPINERTLKKTIIKRIRSSLLPIIIVLVLLLGFLASNPQITGLFILQQEDFVNSFSPLNVFIATTEGDVETNAALLKTEDDSFLEIELSPNEVSQIKLSFNSKISENSEIKSISFNTKLFKTDKSEKKDVNIIIDQNIVDVNVVVDENADINILIDENAGVNIDAGKNEKDVNTIDQNTGSSASGQNNENISNESGNAAARNDLNSDSQNNSETQNNSSDNNSKVSLASEKPVRIFFQEKNLIEEKKVLLDVFVVKDRILTIVPSCEGILISSLNSELNCDLTSLATQLELENVGILMQLRNDKVPSKVKIDFAEISVNYSLEMQKDENVEISGSSVFSALAIYDLQENLVASGTEKISLQPGKYNARIDFIDSRISFIELNEVLIDSSVNLISTDFDVNKNLIETPDENIEWIEIIGINPNVSFLSGFLELIVPENSEFLFKCSEYDFGQRICNGTWEKLTDLTDQELISFPFNSSDPAYGFAKTFVQKNKNIKPKILFDKTDFKANENIAVDFEFFEKKYLQETNEWKEEFEVFEKETTKTQEELDLLEEKLVKKPKQKDSWIEESDDEEFNVIISNNSGNNIDFDVEIEELRNGKFSIQVENKRSFVPGKYSMKIELTKNKESFVQELDFTWGLVSLNSKKSIYKKGETAEFVIVVLDGGGHPVCNADISMKINDPVQGITNLSTKNNGIIPNAECGLYDAFFETKNEGTHNISINAKSQNVEADFETNFLVQNVFDYDIIRTAQSKIDPTITDPITNQINNFYVKIDVESFNNSNAVEIQEFVPKEFLVLNNNGAIITETDDAKILTWNKNLIDGKTFVEYNYSVPLIWPYLYELGELEINENGNSFIEARPWFIAVDPPIGTGYTDPTATQTATCGTNPNNAWTSDDSRTGCNTATTGQYDAFGFNIPIGADIKGIQARLEWLVSGGSFTTTAQLVKAGTATGGTNTTPTNSTKTSDTTNVLASDTNLWDTTWTPGDINNVDFGVLLTATRITGTGGTRANWDNIDINISYVVNDGNLSHNISSPPSDNNTSININTNFLVEGTVTCNGASCGSTDTNLQYCVGAGCTAWLDLNTVATSPLFIVSGTDPQTATLDYGNIYTVSWVVQSTVAQSYELRLRADGATTDVNTTNGTDRTITTQTPPSADYSFVLLLPSSGCTLGKGSTDANAYCEVGYFESTDTSGVADQNKVDAEGQTATIPFFVYDNQSTAATDFNIIMDLNASLPASLQLKVARFYANWNLVCSDQNNSDGNCVLIDTSLQKSIGKAFYTTGVQDLNIFVWGDFIAAPLGSVDRNADSNFGVS